MKTSSNKHSADHILLLTVIGLTLFGFIMVASSSAVLAERFQNDPYFFVKHQVLFGGLVGLIVFCIGFFVPYRTWRVLALPALIGSLILLVLVFVPGLQVAYGGAARWVGIGPITLQPSEITKLAYILYLAALLEKFGEDVGNWKKSLIPFLAISGLIGFLIILQPDMGTLVSISLIAGAMIFVAGIRYHHLAFIILLVVSAFAIFLNTAKYRLERIMVYLHPELYPQGIGYQINQALLAVGTGGLWGLGLGRSRQKHLYLPEPAGDSIFAITAEEMGFLRSILILAGFAIIGYRGLLIARKSNDIFGKLLACGITAWILIQAFMNMGAILAIIPLTGIPLPFVSYGGSALATLLFATGILLNISKYTIQDNS